MLKTKLTKPTPTSKLIFRKELTDKLEQGHNKKLTLVSAPAGYGKSTLISQWIDVFSFQYSWYSLDKSDNEISTFLKYTIAGIQSEFPDLGSEAMKLLESNTSPSPETIATLVINDFYEIKERFTIIFDDYHLIENTAINDLLYFLLGNLPPHVHIVLITRSDPSIPLAKLRSQQMITDIRLADLCFNANNIYDFLRKSMNINLTIEDAKNLESKTEGWIAGLQLTGLLLQGKEDVGTFVDRLKGDNRYIMDYLIEEVLQELNPELRDFLLCTSILNRFNSFLCDFMLDIPNSQEIIEHIEKNNMFIIPLDDERNWFRYHHLFAGLLQQRLAVTLKNRIPVLHSKASEWFENNDQLLFALEHSLAAGNKDKALNHFGHIIDHLWRTSQYQTILQFGGKFTHEEIIKNAALRFNYFWILFQSGQMEQAESIIDKLHQHTTDKAQLAMVYVCLNNLKVALGNIESAYSYAELGLEHITENADYWNILAFLSLGEIHLLRCELAESVQNFDQAAERASMPHFIYFEMINRSRYSFVLWTLGDYIGAYNASNDLLNKLNTAAESHGAASEFLTSLLNGFVGVYLVNINQIKEGLQKSVRGYDLAKKTTNPLLIASCTYLLAEAYYSAGESNKAINLLEELDGVPYKHASKFLCIQSDKLKSKVYLLTNNHEKLKPLINRDIKANKDHAFETILHRVNKARYHIATHTSFEAIEALKEISDQLKQDQIYGLLTEVQLLQAKAHVAIQQQQKAIEFLAEAIHRTQNTGMIRIYINEGETIEALLHAIKTEKRQPSDLKLDHLDVDYINKILKVFEKEKRRSVAEEEDSLSTRELDTLKLIAENLSNQEIADELFVSVTTVKTHVRNILIKLDAKNRNDAVKKAKEKGIKLE